MERTATVVNTSLDLIFMTLAGIYSYSALLEIEIEIERARSRKGTADSWEPPPRMKWNVHIDDNSYIGMKTT